MKKQITIYLMLILSLSLVAFADYPLPGGVDGDYRSADGIFGQGSTVWSTSGLKNLNDAKNMPLSADLDNDGVNEIVVLDGSTYNLYNEITLDSVNSYSSPILTNISDFILFDIDGDNFTEIISNSRIPRTIEIIEYNGTHFYRQNNYTIEGIPSGAGASSIGCRGVEDCLVINILNNAQADWTVAKQGIYGQKFNSTTISDSGNLYGDARAGQVYTYCFPTMRQIVAKDYDADGTIEYVTSLVSFGQANVDQAFILFLDINSSDQPTFDTNLGNPGIIIEDDLAVPTFQPTDTCENWISSQYITAPLVTDIITGGQLETVIGFGINVAGNDEFKMRSYRPNGDTIATYPNNCNADGVILSNIVMGDFYANTGDTDFGVLGFKPDTNTLDFLVANEETPPASILFGLINISSEEFIYDYTLNPQTYNITFNNDLWINSIHASNQDSDPDTDELVTPYGIFDLDTPDKGDFSGCTSNSNLDLIFEQPFPDGVVLMDDFGGLGNSDMLVMTLGNLFYLNDGFINSPGEITTVNVNPCNNGVWKLNTTVQVTVQVEDFDGDWTGARTELYADSPFLISKNWSANTTDGFNHIFTFEVGQKVLNGELDIFGRDVENPLDIDTASCVFSVQDNGLEFGDSSCNCFTAVLEGASSVTTTTLEGSVNLDNNSITNFMDNEVITSLGLGRGLIWLIVMITVAIGLWGVTSKADHMVSFGVIAFVELLLTIFGSVLGFIPFYIWGTIIIVGLVAIALFVGNIFLGIKSRG